MSAPPPASSPSLAPWAAALSGEPVQVGPPPPPPPGVNLALVALPSASYVSGDTRLAALNDGAEPRNSHDTGHGMYGNWNRRAVQWVQYEWTRPISTARVDVYWWKDFSEIGLPAACRLKYWDGKDFVEAKNAVGLGVKIHQYNVTTFDEVTTTRLRLETDSEGRNSTGILEWRVYDSGRSPKFPPTVEAGVDRVVMLGGRTFLNGAVKTLEAGGGAKCAWSRESGPGEVTFADPAAPVTTATFSAPGAYVLRLTAGEGDQAASDTLSVRAEVRPEGEHLIPVYTKRYQVRSPLWNHRQKALITTWIPHCVAKLSEPDLREGGINNIEAAARKLAGGEGGRHRGYPFADAYLLNVMESMCVALMVDPQGDGEIAKAQEGIRSKLQEWIPKVLAAQEPDGYFQTRFTLDPRAKRWTLVPEHEGYVAGYFLEMAIVHSLLSGGKDARLYQAAKRLADCWCDNLGPAPKRPWFDGHQEMEQALVRFGRYAEDLEGGGKGRKYIDLARFLLDCRKGGDEYDQSHLPVIQQYVAVGHSVRAAYSYSGMAGVAMETGDIDYQSAVASLWDNLVNRKYYVTGGLGSGETSEGFGPDFSLGNRSYCESCANCGGLFLQQKMNMAYRDSRYADLAEETLYNGILGDFDLEGKNFYYQNPLDGGGPRYPWHGCPCCVGNFPRVLLMLPTWMYLKGGDSLYVNLFAGSTVTVEGVAGTDVELVQETDYPWKGAVSITVNPKAEKEFSLRIRSPRRDGSALYRSAPAADGLLSLSVNGALATPPLEKGYVVLKRTWKAGDRVSFEVPLRVQRVKADERIEADRGRVALRYGPLVYNIESVDQDVDKVLAPEGDLSAEWMPDLLGGVVAIKGKFADGAPLLAIPHWARVNRSTQGRQGQGGFGGPGAEGGSDGAAPKGRRADRGRSIVWIRDR